MKTPVRHGLCLALAFLAAIASGHDSQAQEPFYKGKTISLIIGSNTSGGYDTYGRLLARHMGRHLAGNPAIVVQNMPGAGGLRSANHLLSVAPRDGTAIGGCCRPGRIAVAGKAQRMTAEGIRGIAGRRQRQHAPAGESQLQVKRQPGQCRAEPSPILRLPARRP